MQIRKGVFGLAMGLFAMILLHGSPAHALICAGPIQVGLCLDRLESAVRNSIADARNAGNELLINGGLQLATTIRIARREYEGALDKTLAQVDQKIRSTLTDIDSKTQNLLSGVADIVETATAGLQQIANSFPLASQFPQVTRVSPAYVVPERRLLRVTFAVNVPRPYEAGRLPVLRLDLDDVAYTSEHATTQQISFILPAALRDPGGPLSPVAGKIRPVPVRLEIPWKEGRFFPRRRTAVFPVVLPVLPENIGAVRVVLTPVPPRQRGFTNRGGGRIHHQAGPRTEDYCAQTSTQDAAQGWVFVSGSAQFEVQSSGTFGPWAHNPSPHSTATRQCWTVTTSGGTMNVGGIRVPMPNSSVRFKLLHDEERTFRPPSVSNTRRLRMTWKEQMVISAAAGTWKVVLEPFGGGRFEYVSADLSNPLLEITATGTDLTLRTYTPSPF